MGAFGGRWTCSIRNSSGLLCGLLMSAERVRRREGGWGERTGKRGETSWAGEPAGPRTRSFGGSPRGRAVVIRWPRVGKKEVSSHSHTRHFPQLHERALRPKSAMRTIVPFASPLQLQMASATTAGHDHLPPPHQHDPQRAGTPQHPDLNLLVKLSYTYCSHASVLNCHTGSQSQQRPSPV